VGVQGRHPTVQTATASIFLHAALHLIGNLIFPGLVGRPGIRTLPLPDRHIAWLAANPAQAAWLVQFS
jgi:hypothetical protein